MRHAYLIMAHNEFQILEMLLKDLDDAQNDIFLHIDLKSNNVPWDAIKGCVKKSKLFLVEQLNVNWGGYSQIKCELHLLENAINVADYDFYHFMCGTEFPLKSQKYIHDFFEKNVGKIFLEYDDIDTSFINRVKYKHYFNEIGRTTPRNGIRYLKFIVRQIMLTMQKWRDIDISAKYGLELKKGNANWSIPSDLAKTLIEKKAEIEEMYRDSYCADEVFLHTVVFNSDYRERIYFNKEAKSSNARMTQWERKDNCYYMEDVQELLKSSGLFARKFLGLEGMNAIKKILELREE